MRTRQSWLRAGGYGTGPVLDLLSFPRAPRPKLVVGYSDLTMLHAYLWRRWRWVTLYGPMVAAGFDKGADRPGGYDRVAWLIAASGERRHWELGLGGEALFRGEATGIVLGGCLTLLQATIGTPWEFDARGAILLLEDVGVKPYQVDRMLMHLAQAGKFRGVRGIILGEFPGFQPGGQQHGHGARRLPAARWRRCACRWCTARRLVTRRAQC